MYDKRTYSAQHGGLAKTVLVRYNEKSMIQDGNLSRQRAGEFMRICSVNSKTVSIFPGNKSGSPLIYLNTVSDEGRQVYEAAQAAGCPPFNLVAISNLDWNCDMAPWDSPAAFRGGEAFTGGADNYLRLLVEEIMPEAEKELPGPPAWRGIAGYSLAGLFALYATAGAGRKTGTPL